MDAALFGALCAHVSQKIEFHFPQGERAFLCAVSGGEDSVALLHIMRALARSEGFAFYAAHFNHGLRPEAGADEAFVRAVCARLSVELFVGHAHALRGDERTAREARYAFLCDTALACSAPVIVTAHHKEDQAETVLLHMARGSGLTGITGMRPLMRLGACRVFRPLLDVDKARLCALGLEHVYDASNDSPRYTRNRVRAEVLPALRAINPDIVGALCRLADAARADDLYIRASLPDGALTRIGRAVALATVETLPPSVGRRLVMCALEAAGAEVTMQNVEAVLALAAHTRIGAVAELQGRVAARRGYSEIVFGRQEAFDIPFAPGDYETPSGVVRVCPARAEQWRAAMRPRAYPEEEYVDADAIPEGARLRTYQKGDRIAPLGGAGTKEMRAYFSQKRVSPGRREGVPLVCAGNAVLWAGGLGIAESARVTDATARAWRLKWDAIDEACPLHKGGD